MRVAFVPSPANGPVAYPRMFEGNLWEGTLSLLILMSSLLTLLTLFDAIASISFVSF